MTKKVGLALGSGSARGWSHIGVIRSIQDAGVPIDIACGSSIGALVAGALAANFLDTLDEWVRALNWTDILRFMDVRLPRSGIIEGDKITDYFKQNLSDARIEDLSMPFAAVATDLNTGREVWLRQGSLIDAIRASVSLPGIFTPYQQGEHWLVDGTFKVAPQSFRILYVIHALDGEQTFPCVFSIMKKKSEKPEFSLSLP